MIAGGDSTVSLSYLIDMLNLDAPAVVAEDQPYPRWAGSANAAGLALRTLSNHQLRIVGTSSASGFREPPIEVGAVSVATAKNMPTFQSVLGAAIDPWLKTVEEALAVYRSPEFWDLHGVTMPSAEALQSAEYIAQSFVSLPMQHRPQLLVDAEGQPSFSLYSDDLYLDLSLDENGLATWYSSSNGDELFGDDEDLTKLPADELIKRVVPFAA